MWPLVLDIWMKDNKKSKWWTEGGSKAFYRSARDSVINLIPQTAASIGNCLLNAKRRDFLPSYLERNSEHIRPLATVLSTEEVNKTIQRQSQGQFLTFRR